MSNVWTLTVLVDDLEKGTLPPGYPDRFTAITNTINQICARPWQTTVERDQAHSLTIRLELIKRREGLSNRSAVPVAFLSRTR